MPIKLNVGSEFNEEEARRVKAQAVEHYKRNAVELEVKAKLNQKAAADATGSAKRYFAGVAADLRVNAHMERDAAAKVAREFNRELSRHEAKIKVNVDQDSLKSLKQGKSALMEFFDSVTRVGTAMVGVRRVLSPIAIVGVGAALIEVAGIAASAAQSLWLLPAAAGGAAAAFGTLKLATNGFGDALQNMGDPEKFAEALRNLAPSAQQAALSIQALMPEFKKLQQVTQDSLFQGVGQQLNQLSNQFLPTIQGMTTGIAGAFNSMFKGIGDQLMTPETQGAMQSFMNDITAAFQKLAPAVAPFTRALADIMAVGSSALPGLAQAATDAAVRFGEFISQARKSGDLKRWLDEGLDTLKQLGGIVIEVARGFMELAPVGRAVLPDIARVLRAIADAMPVIGTAAMLLGPSFGAWEVAVRPMVNILDMVKKGIDALKPAFQAVANSIIPLINQIGQAFNLITGPMRLMAKLAGIDISEFSSINQLDLLSSTGQGSSRSDNRTSLDTSLPTAGLDPFTGLPLPGGPGGGGGIGRAQAGIANAQGTVDRGSGWGPRGGIFADPTWAKGYRPKFGSEPGGAGGGAADAAKPYFPESQWQVMPDMSQVAPGADPSGVISAAQSLSEANLRLLELKSKENVAQSTLVSAENNVLQAQQKLHKEQQDTWEEMDKTARKFSAGMDQIGVALDQDFGLSKGLPGLAENLVKFLGNLAAAPILGPLAAISAAQGGKEATGSGFIGMIASQMGVGGGGAGGGGGAASMFSGGGLASSLFSGGGGGTAGMNPNLAAMYDLAQSSSGKTKYAGASNLANGLADCSGSISDLVEVLQTGQSSPARRFTTTNFATDAAAAQQGFFPGYQPGALNVGVNPYPGMSGHMAATLPNGVNFEGGGGTGGGGQYGGPASGALDPQFEKQYYMPVPSMKFDNGDGWIQPGPTIVQNNTGKPEHLSTPEVHAANNPTPGIGVPPGPMPGVGGALGGPSQVGGGPSQIGGKEKATPPGAAQSGGGAIGAATGAAAMAADMFAPGSGAAVQIASQEIQRAIKFGSQAAAIGVGGLMDTFLPTGGSDLANNNWITRVAGGFAGVQPQIPNLAGKSASVDSMNEKGQGAGQTANPFPASPGSGGGDKSGWGPPTVINNITSNNNGAANDQTAEDWAGHLRRSYAAPATTGHR